MPDLFQGVHVFVVEVGRDLLHVLSTAGTVHQVEGDSEVSEAARPAYSVEVGLWVGLIGGVEGGQVGVDHQQHPPHVDASGQHVGRDQHVYFVYG